MRELDKLSISTVASRQEDIRKEVAAFFWTWYQQHKDDTILKKRIFGLFTVDLKVKDIRPIFVQLFGPQPFASA